MTVLVFLNWPEACFRVNKGDLDFLRSLLPLRTKIVVVESERAFVKNLPQATHVLTWHFKREWYARAPRLLVVATPAAGRELVAPPAETKSKVRVHYGTFQGRFMSESVAAFCLAWARGFFRQRLAPPKMAAWPRTWMGDKVFTLAGTKAAIIGYGHVGRAIGEKLATLGVDVRGFTHAECDELRDCLSADYSSLTRRDAASPKTSVSLHGDAASRRVEKLHGDAASRRVEKTKLRHILLSADWLILALPSTTGTDDFLDAALLSRLSPRCVVINVGRGNAIDERALYSALKARRLAGAYLDVRKYEPSWASANFGTNDDRLAKLDNVILTPHDSAFATDYMKAFFRELKDDGCI